MAPRVPPPPVVRAVENTRAAVGTLHRKMVPGAFAVLEMMLGAMVTQTIYVAAELDIAGLLHADGPMTAEQIARKVDADPEALGRLLVWLDSQGIFSRRADGRYELTPMADALRDDHPMSMRGMARLMGHPTHWEEWPGFLEVVRTGEPGLPKLRGMHPYEFLQLDREYGEVFFAGMGNLSAVETLPLLAAYDFSKFRNVVDVGAGQGALLAAVLKKAPQAHGILFDERAGRNGSAELLAAQGVTDRVTVDTGEFFGPVPAGGDLYLLKHILHDWPEPKAIEILTGIRKAMSPHARLLIMEFVLPEGDKQHVGKLIDLWLMLLIGGRERTGSQYAELLSKAGLRLERVVPTAATISIVEAVPA